MGAPSKFGSRKPEVIEFIRKLSAEDRKRGRRLSLSTITDDVRKHFHDIRPRLTAKPKPLTATEKRAGKKLPTDSLKHVIYQLCNQNGIWFGHPSRTPVAQRRLKAAAKA